MSNQQFQIKRDFLSEDRYSAIVDLSKNLNIKFNQFCSCFQQNYQIIKQGHLQLHQVFEKDKTLQRYHFVHQFKTFILDLSSIAVEMTSFQIKCLQNIKQENYTELQIFTDLTANVKQNNNSLLELEKKKDLLVSNYVDIKTNYNYAKQKMKKPIYYYDYQYMGELMDTIQQKIEKSEKLMDEIKQKTKMNQTNVNNFDPILSVFRKKLIKNKYSVHKKIHDLHQNSQNALIQFISLNIECIRSKKVDFQKIISQNQDDILTLSAQLKKFRISTIGQCQQQNIRWEKSIKKAMIDYVEVADYLEYLIKQILRHFSKTCKFTNQQRQKCKSIIYKIRDYYYEEESPLNQMLLLQDLFYNLCSKFTKIHNLLQDSFNRLKEIKNKCKKHCDIVLSLLKIRKATDTQRFQEQFPANDLNSCKSLLKELINQISFKQIKSVVLQIYQSFFLVTNELSLVFVNHNQFLNTRVIDSMQISHFPAKRYVVDKKKPSKQEMWLWKDWKVPVQANFSNYNQLFEQIKGIAQRYKKQSSTREGAELQKYKCLLKETKVQGQLKIKAKGICFQSSQSTKSSLFLGWKEILEIKTKSNFLTQAIELKMQIGTIELSNFENISNVVESLKENHQKNLSGNKTLSKKIKVALTAEEEKTMKERKQKIYQDIPKTQKFRLISQTIFDNEQIDQFYDIFYSDKPFNFYGREQPCFFSFCGKKAGNFDWVAQKYDKAGPKFYTLQEGVDFTNCPTFSTRKITYSHPLPSIPFMPSSCANVDERRMYWIDNEQLQYYIRSQTSGIPLSDSFYVQLIHKIKRQQSGVKLQIFSQIVFTKNVTFPSMIVNNTDPEIDKNMKDFISEIQKVLKLRKSMSEGAPPPIEITQAPKQGRNDQSKEVNKLKLHNKFLMGGLALLILINILVKIFL